MNQTEHVTFAKNFTYILNNLNNYKVNGSLTRVDQEEDYDYSSLDAEYDVIISGYICDLISNGYINIEDKENDYQFQRFKLLAEYKKNKMKLYLLKKEGV
jgi:hypothetical protein